MDPSKIRNFSIIAHIDHGKSTLADRFLEITGTVRTQDMKAQFLDRMDLERERGITIKGKAVSMIHEGIDQSTYQLNLIDTPGHVDFSYEVSRALAACEGALLVVDASQGVEAQTIANALMALDYDLVLIPVINKIDLPQAEPERVAAELKQIFGFNDDEMLFVSAKDGTGAMNILNEVILRVPPPKGLVSDNFRGLVFDSLYDSYKGIITYIRATDGVINKSDKIKVMSSDKVADIVELGIFTPAPTPVNTLYAGQVGYIATGFKDVKECAVGDTLTNPAFPAENALEGYKPLKSMVFAGLYPSDGEDYDNLRNALQKLQLNDASLTLEPESSSALGFGFRCGFLGLMHLEIVQERLEREYNLDIIATSPNVSYQVHLKNKTIVNVENPDHFPNPAEIDFIEEPILKLTIMVPGRFVGPVMELMHSKRSEYKRMEYIQSISGDETFQESQDNGRVMMEYIMPLSELITDFYNQIKSKTQGYASLDYTLDGYQVSQLIKIDILVNKYVVEALSMIVHKDQAVYYGKSLVSKLHGTIPRQMFEVPIQASIGGRVIARETVRAVRKDVLAKCYGGDITRKRKLLEKQKEGKKRLKSIGRVEVPQEAFLTIMNINS
ncbi:MAG TPA: elongation factor 4 [Dehalococcoidia bacterium]|nr:elongation factor 4 [Dehalococcoidia bacterium]